MCFCLYNTAKGERGISFQAPYFLPLDHRLAVNTTKFFCLNPPADTLMGGQIKGTNIYVKWKVIIIKGSIYSNYITVSRNTQISFQYALNVRPLVVLSAILTVILSIYLISEPSIILNAQRQANFSLLVRTQFPSQYVLITWHILYQSCLILLPNPIFY